MFPGNRNKTQLIKKIITIKSNYISEQDNNETYLGDTIEDDYEIESKNSVSFIPNKVEEISQKISYKKSKQPQPSELLKKCSSFHFPIKSILQTNYKDLNLEHNQQIFLCAYHIDTDYLKPYLSYLLYNYSESSENLFYFPFFSFNDSINLQKQVIEQFTFLTKFDVKPLLSGYIKHNNDYYFFLDIKSISDEDKRDNNYVWSLIDEIVNTKKIFNIPIHHSISSIFNENTELIFLYDEENYPYEIPSVVYTGDEYNVSSFNSVFGQRKSATAIKSLEDMYTFYDYETSLQKISKDEEEGGIVRYAIFIGKMKVFLKENLSELLGEEKETTWTKYFHSAYVGKVTLPNGEKIQDTPILIVQHSEQQIPLSLRKINK